MSSDLNISSWITSISQEIVLKWETEVMKSGFFGGIVTLRETTVPLKSPKKPHCRGAEDSPYLWYHHLGSRSNYQNSPQKNIRKAMVQQGMYTSLGEKMGVMKNLCFCLFPHGYHIMKCQHEQTMPDLLGEDISTLRSTTFSLVVDGGDDFLCQFCSCLLKRRDYNDYNRDIELFISSRARTSTAAAAVAAELLPVQLDKPNKSLTT